MLQRVLLILFLITCIQIKLFAQKQEDTFDSIENEYLRGVFANDSSSKASLIFFDFQYQYTLNNYDFSTNGLSLETGVNLGRLITKKIILGIGLEGKLFSNGQKQIISSGFREKFNEDFITTYSTTKDSLRAYSLYGAFNNEPGFEIKRSSFYNFCFTFSPFLHKYGGIIIQYKYGVREFFFKTPYREVLSTTDDGWVYLTLSKCQSLECSFFPFKFNNSPNNNFHVVRSPKRNLYKQLMVSVMLEKTNFSGAIFNSVNLESFVEDVSALNKQTNYHLGLKLGMFIQ